MVREREREREREMEKEKESSNDTPRGGLWALLLAKNRFCG